MKFSRVTLPLIPHRLHNDNNVCYVHFGCSEPVGIESKPNRLPIRSQKYYPSGYLSQSSILGARQILIQSDVPSSRELRNFLILVFGLCGSSDSPFFISFLQLRSILLRHLHPCLTFLWLTTCIPVITYARFCPAGTFRGETFTSLNAVRESRYCHPSDLVSACSQIPSLRLGSIHSAYPVIHFPFANGETETHRFTAAVEPCCPLLQRKRATVPLP